MDLYGALLFCILESLNHITTIVTVTLIDAAEKNENRHSSRHFKCLHDLRVVRASSLQTLGSLESDRD